MTILKALEEILGSDLVDLRDAYLLRDLSTAQDIDEKIQLLETYMGIHDKTSDTTDRWAIVDKILEDEELDILNPRFARGLFNLSRIVPNQIQGNQLQEIALENILSGSFDDGYDFLVSDLAQRNLTSIEPVAQFIEDKATTHDHFSRLKEKVDSLLGYEEKVPDLMELLVFEELVQYLTNPSSSVRFLSGMVQTQSDEFKLIRMLYNSDIIKRYGIDQVRQTLYRSSFGHRYALLRNILASDTGALGSVTGRRNLHTEMMAGLIDRPADGTDQEWYRHISDLTGDFLRFGAIENVYFVLVPLLVDRILNPPQQSIPIERVMEDYVVRLEFKAAGFEGEIPFHLRALHGEDVRKELENYFREEIGIMPEDEDFIDDSDYSQIQENVTEFYELNRKFRQQVEAELKFYKGDFGESDREQAQSNALIKFLGEPKPRSEGKLSTLEFIVSSSKNLGAPGVRFLQLLGQYVSVPDGYQREFNKVYDSVSGQSKLAAYMLLERKWEGFKDEVVEFRPTVGGGSLMTVYEILTGSGQREVVKVLNPNAEFHTESSFKVIRDILERRARADPLYEVALPIIDDIKDWIVQDINFTGFLGKDKSFYQQNDGYTVSGSNYKIKVPKSIGLENKFYKREEYIDGVNLTQEDELLQKGHDLKDIVSVVTQNYLGQIARGHVHSDVHPGNFRVTDDGEVAILDRNYFLELDMGDKMLLHTLGQDTAGNGAKADAVVGYLRKNNDGVPDHLRDGIYQALEGSQGVQQLGDVIRYIKGEKVKVPLKMTLLVKNLFALNSLAQSAGFSGMQDAVRYRK